MIETVPYRDFVTLTRAVIDELQFHIQQERSRWSSLSKGERIPLRTLRGDAAIASKIGESLVEHYDFRRDSLGIPKIPGGDQASTHLAEKSERLKRLPAQLHL